MPSEILCNQLTLMSQALQQAARIINSKEIHNEQGVLAKKTCTDYQNHQRGDHRQVLQRKQMIEARKEFIENTQKEKVHEHGMSVSSRCLVSVVRVVVVEIVGGGGRGFKVWLLQYIIAV